MKRITMTLGTIAAATAFAGAATAQATTFDGGCVGGGLGSSPSTLQLTCTGALNGAPSATYHASLPVPAGTTVPTGLTKQPYVPTALDVLRTGPSSMTFFPQAPPFLSERLTLTVIQTLNGYAFTGATGGYGYGYGFVDALGDTGVTATFSGLAG